MLKVWDRNALLLTEYREIYRKARKGMRILFMGEVSFNYVPRL